MHSLLNMKDLQGIVKGTFRESLLFLYYWSQCSEILYANIKCNAAFLFLWFFPILTLKINSKILNILNISLNLTLPIALKLEALFFIWIGITPSINASTKIWNFVLIFSYCSKVPNFIFFKQFWSKFKNKKVWGRKWKLCYWHL